MTDSRHVSLKSIMGVLAATTLFITSCTEAKDSPQPYGPNNTKKQILDIPVDDGIHYIGDKRTGFCFAIYKSSLGMGGMITTERDPCTKEVLALIPNPEDRPDFKPQEPADPALNLK